MAINSFEDALALIKDADKAKLFKEVTDEVPELKGGWLRQSDFSRHMNELGAEKKRLEADIKQLEEWRAWRRERWDEDAEMTKSELEKVQQLEQTKAELEILKAGADAGMTFEEVTQYIDKELTKKNVITREYVDKELRPKLMDKEEFNKQVTERLTGLANGMEYLYEETLPLAFAYKDEFGGVMKVRELTQFANENGFKDISKAYDSWVSEKRAEATKKNTEAALAKAKEEGRQEALKEKGMSQDGRKPVDEGPPVMGHLEARLKLPKDQQTDQVPDELPMGQMHNWIAQQYRKNTAEGKVVTG